MHKTGIQLALNTRLSSTNGGFLSIQLDEKGYVIIGEAALALALREQNIDVLSLINELNSMAEFSLNDERFIFYI